MFYSKLIQALAIIALSSLITVINCGQLSSSDVELDYSNAQYVTNLSIRFYASTPLKPSNFMKIKLPFPLHTSLMLDLDAPSNFYSPLLLSAQYAPYIASTNAVGPSSNTRLYGMKSESSTYYIRFLDSSDSQTSLGIGWYRLSFKISDLTGLSLQKESVLLSIQLTTLSSISSTAITFDDNSAHSFMYLDSAPSSSLKMAIYFDNESTRYSLSTTNLIYFDFSVDSSIIDSIDSKRFIISFSGSDFNFYGSTCQNTAKITQPSIASIATSLYTCSIDNNQMTILLLPDALSSQSSFRFQAQVKNPPTVVNNSSVNIYALREMSPKILQVGKVQNALQTKPLILSQFKITLAWGITDLPTLPMNAYIVRGSPPTLPGYSPYNQINLRFQVNSNFPATVEQRVIIKLNTPSTSLLLSGSIITNLPAFQDRVVICNELDALFQDKRRIICSQVGNLNSASSYFITFKMSFQFDIYEASISTSTFGLLSIESMKMITPSDTVFAISRDINFAEYMRETFGASTTVATASLIQIISGFPGAILLANAQDFPNYTQEVFATIRPVNYSGKFTIFEDFFVPSSSSKFLEYLSSSGYTIYISQVRKMDSLSSLLITKSNSGLFTVLGTVPSNLSQILTKNGNNWLQTSDDIFATSTTTTATSADRGIKFSTTSTDVQTLSLFFNAPFADATDNVYASSGNPTFTNGVGLQLLMNPLITFTTPVVTGGATVKTQSSLYTSLTTTFSTQSQLATFFPNIAVNTQYQITNFVLQQFAYSVDAIQTNLDIFLQTKDGISGPLSLQVKNAYVLINAYVLSLSALSGLSASIVNYWSTSASGGIDGSMIPAFILLTGTLSDTSSSKLSLFFDNGNLFSFTGVDGQVSCSSTLSGISNPSCVQYLQSSVNTLSYWHMNRLDITLTPVFNSAAFQILIPIQIPASVTSFLFRVATINTSRGMNQVKSFAAQTFTLEASALAAPLTSSTSANNYGFTCATCKVGNAYDQSLSAYHTGGTIAANTATLKGAGYTYVVNYQFYTSSSSFSTVPSYFGSGTQSCLPFLYRISAANKYGIFCPLTGTITSTGPVILQMSMPQYPLLQQYGGYSTNTGLLQTLIQTQATILKAVINTPSIMPFIPASQAAYGITFTFLTPVDLPTPFSVELSDPSGFSIQTRQTYESCQAQISLIRSVSNSCALSGSSLSTLIYVISSPQGKVHSQSVITITHFGLQTASSGTSTSSTSSLTILDSTVTTPIAFVGSLSVIFNALDQTILPTIGVYPTSMNVKKIKQSTLNKSQKTTLYAFIEFTSKFFYPGEYFTLDLDTFSAPNQATSSSLEIGLYQVDDITTAYDYTLYQLFQLPLSSDLLQKSISYTAPQLTIQFTLQKQGFSKYTTYLLIISNLINPTTEATLVFRFYTLPTLAVPNLIQTISITSPTLESALTASNPTLISTLTKKNATPGSSLEIFLSLCPSVDPINNLSRVLVKFPTYYPPTLSRDEDKLACFQGLILEQVFCSVIRPRILEIKYFKQNVQTNTFLNLTIFGAVQPPSYSSGNFEIVFDIDSDDQKVSEFQQINDVPMKLNERLLQDRIQIIKSTISSTLLLVSDVTYTFRVLLESTMSQITTQQYIFVNFPQIFYTVFQSSYTSPFCKISRIDLPNKQYAGLCYTYGLKISIAVNEIMLPGYTYDIILQKVPNPSIYGPQIYKWIIEVSEPKGTRIRYRSFSSSSNYNEVVFAIGIDQQLLVYADKNQNTISSLSLVKGVYSPPIFIRRYASSDPIFARSFSLKNSIEASVSTLPSNLQVIVGKQNYQLQFFSTSSIGLFYLQLIKSGDGGFYTNLPPLQIQFDSANKPVIAFQESPLLIEISSTQKYIQLTSLLPIVNVIITFSFPVGYDSKGMVLNTDSAITFTNDQSFGFLNFSFTSSPTDGDIITITLAISGDNADSYKLPTDSVQIKFVTANTSTLTPTVTVTPSALNPTIATLQSSCSKPAAFYWGISLKYSTDTSMCKLTQLTLLSQPKDSIITLLKCFYQYGTINILAGATLSIPLTGLRASSTYRAYGLCVDSQGGTAFTTTEVEFATITNNGKIMKIVFDFAKQPTSDQLRKFTCFLSLFFSAQPQGARTFDGNYCQEAFSPKRMLSTTSSNQLPCVQSGSDLPTTTVNGMVPQTIFFSQNMDVDYDSVSASLFIASRKPCFRTFINSNVLGLPAVINVHTAVQVSTTVPALASTPTVTQSFTWAFFSDLKLSTSGSIFFILDLKTSSPPSPLQVLSSLNQQGKQALVGGQSRYDSSSGISSNFTFTPLTPGENYTIYYLVGNESPFIEQLSFSTVQSLSFMANAIPTISATLLYSWAVIVISIFSL